MSLKNATPIEPLTKLRVGIVNSFNLEDLRLLVFELRGETISAKIQALWEHQEERHRIPDLPATLKQQRPNEDWGSCFLAKPDAKSPYKGPQYFAWENAHLFFDR